MTLVTWRWLTADDLCAWHAELVHAIGGTHGVRDAAALAAALQPVQRRQQGGDPVFALAALYATGICRNRPFIGHNLATALIAAGVFLQWNGHQLTAEPSHAVAFVRELAASRLAPSGFAEWLQGNCSKL